MVSVVIGISGAIGSGKTSLTERLSSELHADVVSFGNVVRAEASQRGLELTRENLQDIGEQLISAGWPTFVRRLLAVGPESQYLVVDGIRHIEARDEIARQLPDARVFLVYVDTASSDLKTRIAARGEDSSSLEHNVESSLPAVVASADLVVGGIDLDADVAAILTLVVGSD